MAFQLDSPKLHSAVLKSDVLYESLGEAGPHDQESMISMYLLFKTNSFWYA